MAKVEIQSGICGFNTIVIAEKSQDFTTTLQVKSECSNWQIVNDLMCGESFNIMAELFKDKKSGKINSKVLEIMLEKIPHISCPVLSGIFKAMEVSCGLALPKDAVIKFL